MRNSVMYRERCPFDGAFLEIRQRATKTFGKNLGVVKRYPEPLTMVGYTTGLRVPTNPMYGGEDAR